MRRVSSSISFAVLLTLFACDDTEELGPDGSPTMMGMNPITGDAAPGPTGGGSPDSGNIVGATDASPMGMGPADATIQRDGGSASPDGAVSADASSGGPSVSGPEPVIPKPSGTCPVFQSGVTDIHGLSVNVYAGPKTPGKKGPLVFHWHGTGGAGDNVETSPFGGADGAGLPEEVRAEILAEGGIIISPTDDESVREGTDVTLILGVWYTPGDLQLADLVAACAVEQQLVDPRRIYTTGCSAGGLMAGVMAFHRSSYLAASVPNSGGVVDFPGMTDLQDTHVPPSMTMHGLQGTDWVIVDFAETSAAMYNALVAKGGFAINCDHGGGHCAAPKALKLAMWQFMKDHPFGVSPEPYANGLPASFPSYCKIIKQ